MIKISLRLLNRHTLCFGTAGHVSHQSASGPENITVISRLISCRNHWHNRSDFDYREDRQTRFAKCRDSAGQQVSDSAILDAQACVEVTVFTFDHTAD